MPGGLEKENESAYDDEAGVTTKKLLNLRDTGQFRPVSYIATGG